MSWRISQAPTYFIRRMAKAVRTASCSAYWISIAPIGAASDVVSRVAVANGLLAALRASDAAELGTAGLELRVVASEPAGTALGVDGVPSTPIAVIACGCYCRE